MGNSVNTELFRAVPAIKGTFESPEDEFDAGRQEIRVPVSATIELKRKFANEASLEKDRTAKRLPEIGRVYDDRSETYNDSVTPGGSAEIKGREPRRDDRRCWPGRVLHEQRDGGTDRGDPDDEAHRLQDRVHRSPDARKRRVFAHRQACIRQLDSRRLARSEAERRIRRGKLMRRRKTCGSHHHFLTTIVQRLSGIVAFPLSRTCDPAFRVQSLKSS
jgi:hypothetical protein